jgi:hypothetical protein
MSDVSPEELGVYDDDFTNADGTGGDYTPTPDGTYTVSVEKVQLKRTKTDKPMLAWQLRIAGPTRAGSCLFKNSLIASAKNVEFLKRDLVACGMELAKLSDLPGRLEELLDLSLEVRKITKGEYENVYIQKLLDGAPACEAAPVDDNFFDGVEEPPPAGEDDSYPF